METGSPYFHLHSPGLALSRGGSLCCSSSPLSESALICSSFSPRRFILFVPSGSRVAEAERRSPKRVPAPHSGMSLLVLSKEVGVKVALPGQRQICGSSFLLWEQSVSISDSCLRPCTLAPIRSSERMAVRHRDAVLAHLKELGLRLNVRKVCFFSTENHLSGRGGDPTTMQARMSPALIESILTSVKRVREGRSLTVSSFRNCWV